MYAFLMKIMNNKELDRCSQEVLHMNRKGLKDLSFGVFYLGIGLLVVTCLPLPVSFYALNLSRFMYIGAGAFFVLLYPFVIKRPRLILPALYVEAFLMMFIGVLMGTIFDPHRYAIAFFVMLVAFPVFILDKGWRLALAKGLMIALFIILAYFYKDSDIFLYDLANVVIYTIVSIMVTAHTQQFKSTEAVMKKQLRYERDLDMLTGIYNRRAGERFLRRYVADKEGTMFMIDVDDFKKFNDRHGHAFGDEVLINVSDILRSFATREGIVFRLGGDEFCLYYKRTLLKEEARQVALELKKEVSGIAIYGQQMPLSLSIGVAFNHQDGDTYEALYRCSDAALYIAKEKKNCFQFYEKKNLRT